MEPDSGVLTNLLTTFQAAFGKGGSSVMADAKHLLNLLVILELSVAGLFWAMHVEKIEVAILKKMMNIGFFIFVVTNYGDLIKVVLQGFMYTGIKAAGGSINQYVLIEDPSKIIDYGFEAAMPIIEWLFKIKVMLPHIVIESFILTICVICILLGYFVLAIGVFITYLEFYLVAGLGLILIPFGVFTHTSFMAEKVFGSIISFGIRLMVLSFILTVSQPLLAKNHLPTDTFGVLLKGPGIANTFGLLLTVLTIGALAWHAPGVASGLMSGSPSLGTSTVVGTGLATIGGIVGVGAGTFAIANAPNASSGYIATKTASGAGTAGGTTGATTAGGTVFTPPSTVETGPANGPSRCARHDRQASSHHIDQSSHHNMPLWAQTLLLAQRSIPPDAHPGPGVHVPLKGE